MDTIKVIKVILCDTKRVGTGVALDPVRVVTEIFDLKGRLIADRDPDKNYTKKDLAEFALFVAKDIGKGMRTTVISDWTDANIMELFKRWKLSSQREIASKRRPFYE